MLPHKFYPIIDDVAWLERLLPVGVRFIQYRNKNIADKDFIRGQIKKALMLGRQYNAIIVINDYWDIAIEEGATWIHLGQDDLKTADKAAIKKAGLKLGTSTHNQAELDIALSYDPDYIALGPVYNTISKKMVMPPQGLKKITQWKQKIGSIPLVGIGGITVQTAPNILSAGADAVACIGDIILNKNPEGQAEKWIRTVNGTIGTSTAVKAVS